MPQRLTVASVAKRSESTYMGTGTGVSQGPKDGPRSGRLEGRYLHEDADVVGDLQPLATGQREQTVVVEHRVEVLGPLGVHVAVEHQPVHAVTLATHVRQHLPTTTTITPGLSTRTTAAHMAPHFDLKRRLIRA
jgi:hypothetical protein